jgi:uncharacterized membrane protein
LLVSYCFFLVIYSLVLLCSALVWLSLLEQYFFIGDVHATKNEGREEVSAVFQTVIAIVVTVLEMEAMAVEGSKVKKWLEIIPCHRRPDRTIHIHGNPMPLCARCTAIYGMYLFLPLFYFVPVSWTTFLCSILLQIPMLSDGLTQLWCWRKSNNTLRVITGSLSGIGQCMMVWFLAKMLIRWLQ